VSLLVPLLTSLEEKGWEGEALGREASRISEADLLSLGFADGASSIGTATRSLIFGRGQLAELSKLMLGDETARGLRRIADVGCWRVCCIAIGGHHIRGPLPCEQLQLSAWSSPCPQLLGGEGGLLEANPSRFGSSGSRARTTRVAISG
jgi:hypothetical protein